MHTSTVNIPSFEEPMKRRCGSRLGIFLERLCRVRPEMSGWLDTAIHSFEV
jgi:hypothetical protein